MLACLELHFTAIQELLQQWICKSFSSNNSREPWSEAPLSGPRTPNPVDWGKSDYELFTAALPLGNLTASDFGDLYKEAVSG